MRSLLDEFQFQCKSDEECQSLKIRTESKEFLQNFQTRYLTAIENALDKGSITLLDQDVKFYLYKVMYKLRVYYLKFIIQDNK